MAPPEPPNDNDPGPPGPAPEPPLDLRARTLPIREFNINRAAGRFASPYGEFGTLYLGEDEFCSFMEAFNQEVLGHGP
jgi:hypothetical protein